MADVKMMQGLQAGYDALPEKYGDTVYICTDTGHCYLGTKMLSPRVAMALASGLKLYYNGSDVTNSESIAEIVANAKGDWYGSQGTYNEIVSDGTIQAGVLYHVMVQADWSDSDPNSLGYIKNRPNLEDNAVLLSGYCSDAGTISNGKLFVYDGFTLLPLYDSVSGYTTEEMPIGSHICVYIDNTNSSWSDESVNSLKAYDSYYEVPLSANGVLLDQYFTNKFSDYDAVWLEVYLNTTHTKWYPVGITGSLGLQVKRLYIYLGSYTGEVQGQSQEDLDKFMLETKNEMYYYDPTLGMIPFNLWEMNQQVGWIEAQLAAI